MLNEISQNALSSLTTQSKGASGSADRVRESSTINTMASVERSRSESDAKATDQPFSKVDGQAIDAAVGQLNNFTQSIQRQLEFSVDEESGKTVVKVIDKESGQMIRSIPSEEILAMQKRLKETGEAIFNSGNESVSLLFQGKA